MVLEKYWTAGSSYIPPPPVLPKYDPKEDAPKWSWDRMRWDLPVEKTKPWTNIGTQPESPDDPDWRGVIRSNVIEQPVPEAYKFGRSTSIKYFWFDTPDYADPFKKLGYSFKWFTYSGLMAQFAMGIQYSTPFTVAHNLDYAKRILIPWIMAGMAGSLTVICLANLRGKKDDVYNYAAAGFLMGSILGRKNAPSWFRWTTVMTPVAMIVKVNAEANGHLFPRINARLSKRNYTGSDGEHGFQSQDLRMGFRGRQPDPGRDTRQRY